MVPDGTERAVAALAARCGVRPVLDGQVLDGRVLRAFLLVRALADGNVVGSFAGELAERPAPTAALGAVRRD